MDHSGDAAARAAALLVSHPSICENQQLLCSLLQTSRSMRDCISQHALHGLLPVTLCRRQHLTAAQAAAAEGAALQLASWLRDHSSLVGSISLSLPRRVMDVVQDDITAALQHAAASPPGLLLRSVTTNMDNPAQLQCLPSTHISQLEFAHNSNDTTAQVAALLAGLTGLCSLRIAEGYLQINKGGRLGVTTINHGPFLAVLAAHTRLTSLEVADVAGGAEHGQHLPASLRKLHFRRCMFDYVRCMHLGHATALTDLCLTNYVYGDRLPPNVQLLEVRISGSSLRPVLALQHLRELQLRKAENLPQAGLTQLLGLTALSRLTLVYLYSLADADGSSSSSYDDDDDDDDEVVDQAAQAWRQLTFLRQLDIGNEPATASTLQAVGSLAQSLESLKVSCEGPASHLVVDTLSMLTGLTRLNLRSFSDQHLAALRGVTQLRELELNTFGDGRGGHSAIHAAAARARALHLASATQLTKLVSVFGGVDDSVLRLSALTGLRHLDISGSFCTDAVLPVIATMPHLTQLDVGRRVSVEGRAVLAAARPELLLTWHLWPAE